MQQTSAKEIQEQIWVGGNDDPLRIVQKTKVWSNWQIEVAQSRIRRRNKWKYFLDYSAPSLLLVSITHPARMPDGPAKRPGSDLDQIEAVCRFWKSYISKKHKESGLITNYLHIFVTNTINSYHNDWNNNKIWIIISNYQLFRLSSIWTTETFWLQCRSVDYSNVYNDRTSKRGRGWSF